MVDNTINDSEEQKLGSDTSQSSPNSTNQAIAAKIVKPPKPEDKPFEEFINEELIPSLCKSIKSHPVDISNIKLEYDERPIVKGECWILKAELTNGRRFWLCFDKDAIASQKTIALAEKGSEPSILECFLVDERKTTLALLVSRILQRLNGQKWLGPN